MSLIISFSSNEWILTREMYYDYFTSGQMEFGNIEKVISKTRNFNFVKAVWAPISHLLSAFGTAFCLNLGCLYYNHKLKFGQLLNISLISSLIFFIPSIFKFFYFIISPDISLTDYNQYSLGSLLFLTSLYDPFWLKSILEVFTLFEIMYWAALAFGLKAILTCGFDESLKLVFSSYLIGLVLWITIKIFTQTLVFNFN